MISIDIETTGLNPQFCQILEFAAVLGDKSFRRIFKHKPIIGEPRALEMHKELLTADGVPLDKDFHVGFGCWLLDLGIARDNVHVIGKNFGSFDLQFLKKTPGWGKHWNVDHRIADIGSMVAGKLGLSYIPSTKQCCELLHVDYVETHRALDDARLVQELWKKLYDRDQETPML